MHRDIDINIDYVIGMYSKMENSKDIILYKKMFYSIF